MIASSLISMIFATILQVLLVVLFGSIPAAIVVAALWPKWRGVRRGFADFRQQHKRRLSNIQRWLDGAVTPANTEKLGQLRPARIAIEEKIFSLELNRRTAPVQIGIGVLGFLFVGSIMVTFVASELLFGRGKGWEGSSLFNGVMFLVPASQFLLGLYFGITSPQQLSDAETTLRMINVQLLEVGLRLPSDKELDGDSDNAPMDNAQVVATTGA